MLQGKKASFTDGQLLKINKKYGTTAFMYTQYPHKRFWQSARNDDLYKKTLLNIKKNSPTMLYLHMPYCEQLCWFCTCHVGITQSYEKVHDYLQYLGKEVDLFANFLKQNNIQPDIREIHLGGGSPTYINESDFDVLLSKLNNIVDISLLDEFAIEIDPRRVDQKRMHFYADRHITRISFGVQDFDNSVQSAINRIQPSYLIENLITPDIRSRFKNGVNFDILVGLPNQTIDTMSETCKEIIRLAPDRVCMNYMHYSPEFAKHQTAMIDGKNGRPTQLPDFIERKNIFISALETLSNGGYVRTGYDHFALPTDANVKALNSGSMSWNELGATPGRVSDCIAFGVSGKSNISDCYFQVYYEIIDYEKTISEGRFPICNQHQLNDDEIIRRSIIHSFRNYFKIQFDIINNEYGINFVEYFKTELGFLHDFEDDGIVSIYCDKIEISEIGHQFANLICRVFDKYYNDNILAADLGERPLVQLNFRGD